MTWPEGQELRLLIDLSSVSRWTGAVLLDLALALVVLLVAPLGWRGGGLLLALMAAGLIVADLRGPLLPAPMMLVLVAVTACGWIWLAGSVRVDRRWVATLGAGVATLAMLGLLAASFVPVSEPVAQRRPERSLLALHQRGLIAPGDVLLVPRPLARQRLCRRPAGRGPAAGRRAVRGRGGRPGSPQRAAREVGRAPDDVSFRTVSIMPAAGRPRGRSTVVRCSGSSARRARGSASSPTCASTARGPRRRR
jgi:hypothetical protein